MIKDRPDSSEQPWPAEKQVASTAFTVNEDLWQNASADELRQYLRIAYAIAEESKIDQRTTLDDDTHLREHIAHLQNRIEQLTELPRRIAEMCGLDLDAIQRGEKPRMVSYEFYLKEREKRIQGEKHLDLLNSNSQLKPAQKQGLYYLNRQIERGTHHDAQGRTRINATTIAKQIGMSASTGERLIDFCKEQLPDLYDIDSHDEPGPEPGQTVPRTYVKVKDPELLKEPDKIAPLVFKKQGGDQYHQCQHCLSFHVKIIKKVTRTIECLDCHHKTILDEVVTEQIQKHNGQQAQKQLAFGQIYHAGYRQTGTLELIDQALTDHPSLMVVDIRYTPESKNSDWTKSAFFARWKDRYSWIKDLGNVNHKDPGNIQISNPERGLAALAEILSKHAVILLCGCPEFETCHRKSVIELYVQKQLAFDKNFCPQVFNLPDIIKPVTPPMALPFHNQEHLREAAELLLSLAGDAETHIVMPPMNPSKYLEVKRKLTVEDLLDHLKGGQARGALCSYQDKRTRGLCWDVDDLDGWELLQQVARTLCSAGYEVLLEESPAGRGGHLWIIFEGLVPASPARQAIYSIVPDLGMVAEYWPSPGKNRVRLPGSYYARYGKQVEQEVRGWCKMISVADNQVGEDGTAAAALLLGHQNSVELARATVSLAPEPVPEKKTAPVGVAIPAPVQRTEAQWFEERPLPVVDATWIKRCGSLGETTYYFAITEGASAAWFNMRHSLEDIQPLQNNRKAFSPNGQERTASSAHWQKNGEERYTDFSNHGLRADGTHDTGDVLEYAAKVWGKPKSKILAETTSEMVKLAKTDLESSARAGRIPPTWLMEVTTPAGWRRYDQLRGQAGLVESVAQQQEDEPLLTAYKLLKEVEGVGGGLHIREDDAWGIQVPESWTDAQYKSLQDRVLDFNLELRAVLSDEDLRAELEGMMKHG